MTIVTLTSADGTTWTVPAGVTSVQADVTGNGSCGGVNSAGQGGGGGGAFASVTALSVTPGATLTINWGSIGTPSNAATAIWISKTGSQPANTTQGALADSGGAAGNGTTVAASGGLAANSIGDVKFDGGSAASGSVPQARGGGGGSAATGSGAGGSGSGITGATGAGNGGTTGVNGGAATTAGCGGGGGGPTATSGNAKAGQIVLTYTVAANNQPNRVIACGIGVSF